MSHVESTEGHQWINIDKAKLSFRGSFPNGFYSCNITTPRYAPQFASRLHFKQGQALPKETPFPFFGYLFFLGFVFLSPVKVGLLEMQPGGKLQAYLWVVMLQPHACAQHVISNPSQDKDECQEPTRWNRIRLGNSL